MSKESYSDFNSNPETRRRVYRVFRRIELKFENFARENAVKIDQIDLGHQPVIRAEVLSEDQINRTILFMFTQDEQGELFYGVIASADKEDLELNKRKYLTAPFGAMPERDVFLDPDGVFKQVEQAYDFLRQVEEKNLIYDDYLDMPAS